MKKKMEKNTRVRATDKVMGLAKSGQLGTVTEVFPPPYPYGVRWDGETSDDIHEPYEIEKLTLSEIMNEDGSPIEHPPGGIERLQ